jgi:hypothetical protein
MRWQPVSTWSFESASELLPLAALDTAFWKRRAGFLQADLEFLSALAVRVCQVNLPGSAKMML